MDIANASSQLKWYYRNRERALARQKAWKEANKERYKESQNRWQQFRRAQRKAELALVRVKLPTTVTIPEDQYNQLFEAQRGFCAVCQMPPRKNKSLVVDASPATGHIRGLLCETCKATSCYIELYKLAPEKWDAYIAEPGVPVGEPEGV